MASGPARNNTLEQKTFSCMNYVGSVANGDRWRVEIELRHCDIRRISNPNGWNLTWLSYYSCCLLHAKSLLVHISAGLWLNAQKQDRLQHVYFTR